MVSEGKRDEEEFHDAEGDVNDLTRPSEWRPSEEVNCSV